MQPYFAHQLQQPHLDRYGGKTKQNDKEIAIVRAYKIVFEVPFHRLTNLSGQNNSLIRFRILIFINYYELSKKVTMDHGVFSLFTFLS